MEAERVVSLQLARTDGSPLPSYEAGAHIDVHLPGDLIRQYSLCGERADNTRYLIAVLLEPDSRGGSAAIHALREGETLHIGAPRNHFALGSAQHYVLLAGGIGITPIIAMAEHLSQKGESFELHYCARSPAQAAFVTRLTEGRLARHVRLYFDEAGPEQRLDLKAVLSKSGKESHVYVCGPSGFIDHVETIAVNAGLPAHQVHREYFKSVEVDTTSDKAFSISLLRSARQFVVPADRTVLQVLHEHGVRIPASCEQGVCGTCVTRVLSGIPDHRDMYFTDQERSSGQFTPCCSRAKSSLLVLDL